MIAYRPFWHTRALVIVAPRREQRWNFDIAKIGHQVRRKQYAHSMCISRSYVDGHTEDEEDQVGAKKFTCVVYLGHAMTVPMIRLYAVSCDAGLPIYNDMERGEIGFNILILMGYRDALRNPRATFEENVVLQSHYRDMGL